MSTKQNSFIDRLTKPSYFRRTRHFLSFYLRNVNRFFAHQEPRVAYKWFSVLNETSDVISAGKVCEDMYGRMFITGEHKSLFDMFDTDMRMLFGGMFGMGRDFWTELGVDKDTCYGLYNFEKVAALHKMQILMCWELFWGDYGKDCARRMANYDGLVDDLYATISMSHFTGLYLGAIEKCLEDNPANFVSTIVNIFMHAFAFVKNTRRRRLVMKKPDSPIWRKYHVVSWTTDRNFLSKPMAEMIDHYYDDEKTMERCLPACLVEAL